MENIIVYYKSFSLHLKVREKGVGVVPLLKLIYGTGLFESTKELFKLECYLEDSGSLNVLLNSRENEEYPSRIAVISSRLDLFLLGNLYEKLFKPNIPVKVMEAEKDAKYWVTELKENRNLASESGIIKDYNLKVA
jgi:hypothetical protein